MTACNRCHQLTTYHGDWPSCRCDDEPGLTLTVAEAASWACVSRSMIYRWLAEGQIVANRATRPARIPMTSLKARWAVDRRAWRLHEGIYRLDRP